MNTIDNMNTTEIKVNFENARSERQRVNNLLVFDALKEKNILKLKENINTNELDRVKDELRELDIGLDLTSDEKVYKYLFSQGDVFHKILSGRISKLASRQGSKDEELQIKTCNITASKYGVHIENLSATAFRALKNEKQIITNEQIKNNNVQKCDCLKSFDGKISGKINGWICAKVCFGSGGHQDNVFAEIYHYCDWVEKYKQDDNEIFVMLVDTDLLKLLNELKEKTKHIKNLYIFDHIEFQKYIIEKFNTTEKETTTEKTNMDNYNKKALDVLTTEGVKAGVEYMFKHPKTGEKMDYGTMRSIYG